MEIVHDLKYPNLHGAFYILFLNLIRNSKMRRKKATWAISRVRGSKKTYPAINIQKILKEAGFETGQEVSVYRTRKCTS